MEETKEIPKLGRLTCGLVAFTASTLHEGTDDCSLLQIGESFCCPTSSESSRYSPR